MLLESGIYRLVYEYYETRILFGYYRYGEHLPSISRICDIFQMAPATVRNALSVLEKKGLIRVDARKTAKVIYKSSPAGFRRNAVKYFAPREAGVRELCESGDFSWNLSGRKESADGMKKTGSGLRKNSWLHRAMPYPFRWNFTIWRF